MRAIAVALVHHPVLDRERRIVTTAITNLDLHDIARSAHTFGIEPYFVVHPIAAQRQLAERVRQHWTVGSGATRIPARVPALARLEPVADLAEALDRLGGGEKVEVWTTSATADEALTLSFADARRRLETTGPPVLVVFGTGWGLAGEIHAGAAHRLAPIQAVRADGYNHLSVRAAAAITFDRLLGRGWGG